MSQQNQQNQQNQENEVRQQNPYAQQQQAGYGAVPGGYNPYAGYVDPSQAYGYGYQQPQQQDFQALYQQQPQQQQQAGFQFPQYPQFQPPGFDQGPGLTPTPEVPGMLPIEQSYIENILRLNKGKLATIYMTFENNTEWNAKIFKGIIEAAGRDHIIISDPQTGMRHLLLMVYLDYVTFDEELNYEYSYGAGADLSSFPPR